MKSPSKIVNRKTIIFVTEKIISILKSSKISKLLLKTCYYSPLSSFPTGDIDDTEGEGTSEEEKEKDKLDAANILASIKEKQFVLT